MTISTYGILKQPLRVGRGFVESMPTLPFVEDDDRQDAREKFIFAMQQPNYLPGTVECMKVREIEALWHLCRGVSLTKELAQYMGVSLSSAKSYYRVAFDTLPVTVRTRESVIRTIWPIYAQYRVPTNGA